MRCAVVALMVSSLALASGCSAVERPSDESTTLGEYVSWEQAEDFAGTSQRVCGPVAAVGRSDDDVFVNVGFDYPDPDRFTIVVWDVGSIDPIFPSTMVCATGEVTLYEGVPEIELTSQGSLEFP